MTIRFASGARPVLCLGFILAVAAQSAAGDSFRVGAGPGCTHATLELALAAAAANGPDFDDIFLAVPDLTLGGRVDFQNHSVTVQGGYPACDIGLPSGRTTIHHNGPNEAFWVHGTSQSAMIFGAVDVVLGGAAGRGFTIDGHGWVTLENSTVRDGQAAEGGNVRVSGANAHFIMVVGSELTLGEATSGDGGGLYCELAADVVIAQNSKVTDNTAFGSGGGIYVDGCPVVIDQFTSGLPGDGLEISRNKAMNGNGGGLAAVGNSSVGLTGWPAGGAPLFVSDNEAALGSGGGIAFEGSSGGAGLGILCGEVSRNQAGLTGGGVYVGGTGSFQMTTDPLPCPAGRGASALRDNRSSSFGGGIFVDGPNNVEAVVTRTAVFGNFHTAASFGAAAAVKGSASLRLESCEIFDNEPPPSSGGVETPRIHAGGTGAVLTVAYSTIVEQTTAPGTAALHYDNASSILLVSSIVQASKTFTSTPTSTQVDCVVVAESASLPLSATSVNVVSDPALLFRLSTATDFSLRRGSPAQDFCDTSVYPPLTTDIDTQDRGLDDTVLNLRGPYDLGADEWRPEILDDGFESGDMTHWSLATP